MWTGTFRARYAHAQLTLPSDLNAAEWALLETNGVAVVIEAQHGCMTGRGVKTPGVGMITSRVLGCFMDDHRSRKEVMSLMGY